MVTGFGKSKAPISRWEERTTASLRHYFQIHKNRKSFWKKDCPSHSIKEVASLGIRVGCPFLSRSRLERKSGCVTSIREIGALVSALKHTTYSVYHFICCLTDLALLPMNQDVSYCVLHVAELGWNSLVFVASSDTLGSHLENNWAEMTKRCLANILLLFVPFLIYSLNRRGMRSFLHHTTL